MNTVLISVDLKGKTDYAPGDTVNGSVTIQSMQGSWTASHADILLFWRTEGRGDQEEGVVAGLNLAESNAEMPTSFSRDFSLTLPALPWSYHGKLLKIHWLLGVYLKGKPDVDLAEEIQLCVHGNAQERERLRNAYGSDQ